MKAHAVGAGALEPPGAETRLRSATSSADVRAVREVAECGGSGERQLCR